MVEKCGHDTLSVFGIGRDESVGFWRGVIRQLLARGALRANSLDNGGTTLALEPDAARPILRGEEQVMLRADDTPADPIDSRKRDPRRAPSAGGSAAPRGEDGPFGALRAWRTEQARSQSVPPYIIFADSVLLDIVAVRPATLDEMGRIKGVGATKLERYGADVLRILAEQ